MVFFIAEIGINHNGNMNIAHELIRQAAICGADAAKFQAYSVDALFGPQGEDPNEEIYKGVKPLELTQNHVMQLKQWCEEEDIEFMCSVFDETRLNWVLKAGVKHHKIASRTAKLTPYLARQMAETGTECFMSLGFDAPRLPVDYPNVKYLYCVSQYPTEFTSLKMPTKFGDGETFYGFSDHTLGVEASLVAIGRGAKVIEKHFTLNKGMEGFDHICSITPDELELLVKLGRQMDKVNRLSEGK